MVMSVRVSVRPSDSPSVRPSGSPSARFPHFSPTCFDILSWNFAHDFVLMYYRSSLSVVTLRQFLKELCFFVNLEYRKCAVFRTFLLHALTYWAEILHVTLFYCTTDQVRVSSFLRQFLKELCLFLNLEYRKFTVFRSFLLHALTYWAEILHMTFFNVLQIKFECHQFPSIFVGVMPLFELRILEILSFPQFSLTCFDILSWNFAYDFVLLFYRSSSTVVDLHQFL